MAVVTDLDQENADCDEAAKEGCCDDEGDEYSRGAPRLPWGIRKQVFREAPVPEWESGRPTAGDRVNIHFTAKLLDGTVVGTSRNQGEPFVFTVNDSPREVVVGMDLAVMTMRKTELAEFKVAPRFAYDDFGSAPLVPPDATIMFEIELIDWERQEDLFGDGHVIKTCENAGDGETTPVRGQDVVITMRCTDRRGQLLLDYDNYAHTVGDPIFGPLSRTISTTLTRMSEGEKCMLRFSKYFAPSTNDRKYSKAVLELHLESVIESRDISLARDRSLIKRVLRRGTSKDGPVESCSVRLLVESAADASGEPIYGFTGPKTLQFKIGHGDVCDALEFAAIQMKIGERVLLTCSPALPQCLELDLGLVNIQSPEVRIVIELVSAESVEDSNILSKAAYGLERKELAGDLYSRGRYALASELYRRLVEWASSIDSADAVLGQTCRLNRAACALKLGDFAMARDLCDLVLESEPSSVKALYRRSAAKFGLSDYNGALKDAFLILKMDETNRDALRLAADIKGAQKRYAKDAKQTAARMITGKDLPDTGDDDRLLVQEQDRHQPVPFWAKLAAISACLPLRPCLQFLERRNRSK